MGKKKEKTEELEEIKEKAKKPSAFKGIMSMFFAAISYVVAPYYIVNYINNNYPSIGLPTGMTENITGTGVFLIISAFLMGYTVPDTRFHGLAGLIQVTLTGYYMLKVLGNSIISASMGGMTLIIDFSKFTYILIASILLNGIYYLGELLGDKD